MTTEVTVFGGLAIAMVVAFGVFVSDIWKMIRQRKRRSRQ